ncbi:MAG TPA: uroporphyrinogen decarboxylase [Ktedonobacterales bacterium]|nr:uroporphyrinogen decarboxylase [Ktedonobacterales bacterium]
MPEASLAHEGRFLRACRREPVDATPIWLMRQAGRYMPEYRALRERHSMLELIQTPELAAAVTLQPMDAFELDAAIIFADILPPLAAMGMELEFVEGTGPVLRDPLRSAADVARLRVPTIEEALGFTLAASRLARQALDLRHLPLIGFSGAPFTLAAYAVEGGGSREYLKVKGLMLREPETWHALMTKLATLVGEYLLAQANAGAQALQLFDSWVGQLAPDDYRQHVAPYTRQALTIAGQAGVPLIHFGTGTSGMLTDLRDAGGTVIGVDWRIDLDAAWQAVGPAVAIQGNLDPAVLLAPWEAIAPRVRRVLDQAGGRAGHIFNVGHGILPATPVDTVKRLVELAHGHDARRV